MNEKELIIVKYGSTSVSNERGMDRLQLNHYAGQLTTLAEVYNAGLVVVSSGSVAVGRALWAQQRSRWQTASERSLAMMGSGHAFIAWQAALSLHDMSAGQLLVTHREVDDRVEGARMLDAIQENLSSDIVTVVNENDALSDEELRKLSYGGDNDGLASHLAQKLQASRLLLMTDQNGLLDTKGRLVTRVDKNNQEWALSLATGGRKKDKGMRTKVKAAIQASQAGVHTHIAGARSTTLHKVALRKDCSTHFVASGRA